MCHSIEFRGQNTSCHPFAYDRKPVDDTGLVPLSRHRCRSFSQTINEPLELNHVGDTSLTGRQWREVIAKELDADLDKAVQQKDIDMEA